MALIMFGAGLIVITVLGLVKKTHSIIIIVAAAFTCIGFLLFGIDSHRKALGSPKLQEEMKFYQVYENITAFQEGDKYLAILREPDGKIRLYELDNIPKAQYVKVVKDEKGIKNLQPFQISSPQTD
jgi:hypothetical protein